MGIPKIAKDVRIQMDRANAQWLADLYAEKPETPLTEVLQTPGLTLDDFVGMLLLLKEDYYGIQGIADIYQCSYKTAQKINAEGILEPAKRYEGQKKFSIKLIHALRLLPRWAALGRGRADFNNNNIQP